jgi:hypothetical protein
MQKFFLVFWGELAVKDPILKALHYLAICALVRLPGFFYFFSFTARGNVVEGVIKGPYFFESVIPSLKYPPIVAGIPHIVTEEHEPVSKPSLGRCVSIVPVEATTKDYAENGSDKPRKKVTWFHGLLSTLVGAILGAIIGFLGFSLAIGHLEYIFTINLLRKMKVPKCLYADPDD